jgi:alpha-glucosidase
MTIELEDTQTKTLYTLECRAFNDGVAFRFIVPGENVTRIPDEATEFIIPQKSIVWYHDLEDHYEGMYVSKEISEVQKDEWIAPPFTYKLPGNLGYAAITEASLVNYAGLALQADGSGGVVTRLGHSHPPSYPYRLRYPQSDVNRLASPARVRDTITTPWRVVMIAPDLNTLVNTDIVHNLCAPPNPKYFPEGIKTDWIKPGRAVWRYLDGGGDNSLANMKEYSRIANELGFEHNILEGFWRRWSDDEIKELTSYSKCLNVGIWVWLHSMDLRSSFTSRAIFEKLHRLGIEGVKIDFFDHEAKETIDLYTRLLEEAAQNKLLVNFHGSNKPTGESRTWPNELTRESVKGMESRRVADRATHETTMPFTRFPAGHGEYTVVSFNPERRTNTTWAHQIASAAILSAPLLTYAATPFAILENPAKEMIKSIPPIWDETFVLSPSEIGEVAVFARRIKDTWFLAIMNGLSERIVNIPLSFLPKGIYNTLIVADDNLSDENVIVGNNKFQNSDSVKIKLRPGGGYIARFSK